MKGLSQENERGSCVEIYGFCQTCADLLPRLHKALVSSGCCMAAYKRRGDSVEYNFEIELAAALDLYCGLVHAGLEMTELTHRTLTELCLLRVHGQTLSNERHTLSLRLMITFLRAEEEPELPTVIAVSARGC